MTDYNPTEHTVAEVTDWAATATEEAKAAALAVEEAADKPRAGVRLALAPITPPDVETPGDPEPEPASTERVPADLHGFSEGNPAPRDLYLTFEADGSRALLGAPVAGGWQQRVAMKGVEVDRGMWAVIQANKG